MGAESAGTELVAGRRRSVRKIQWPTEEVPSLPFQNVMQPSERSFKWTRRARWLAPLEPIPLLPP